MRAGSARPETRPRRRRAVGFGLLVLAMLVAHGLAVDRLSAWLETGLHAPPEPPRLQAAFVRELQQAAPAPAPAAPAPEPAARPRRAAATAPATASAPEPPASSPEVAVAPEPPEPPLPERPPAETRVADAPAAIAPPPAAAAASAPSGPAFDWPLGTRLRYVLTGHVRGEVHGSAQVEWLREGSRYQVHLDVTVGPGFAPLVQRRMSSDGDITPQGLAPRRYDERTQIAFGAARESVVLFEPGEPGTVTLANGRRVPGLPSVQDTASQFVQLTWWFATDPQRLRPGARIEVPLALPRRIDRWVYDVVGEETLDTAVGRVPAWHLKPQREGDASALSIEAWFAPSLQYLPVRIVIRNGPEDFIDLLIDRLPLQAVEEPPAGSVLR